MEKRDRKIWLEIRKDFEDVYTRKFLQVPKVAKKSKGFKLRGRGIHSVIYTTDLVVVRNNNADATMLVYPFTPEPIILRSFVRCAQRPIFVGVGGGATTGKRIAHYALNAEFIGASAVVVNAPITTSDLVRVREYTDLPIIATAFTLEQAREKMVAGIDVLNIAAGKDTPDVVQIVRDEMPHVPILASGGRSDESILKTIKAGANAIVYTAPNMNELMSDLMDQYRKRMSYYSGKDKE